MAQKEGGGGGFFSSLASSLSNFKSQVNFLLGYEGLEVINPEGGTEDAEVEARKGRWKQEILGNYDNWRQVLQVIEWMQARERFKSNRLRNIYTAALDALRKAMRPVEALNMFHTMQQQMASYPDLVAYHCIAVTLGQAGHMRELFHVIDTMRAPPKKKLAIGVLQKWDPRLEPDLIVYNAVLNACVRQKNLEGAFWVLQQLKQHGQQPNSITYGLVMEVSHLAHVRYSSVLRIWLKLVMVIDSGLKTQIVERVVLLGPPVAIKDEKWEAARKVVSGRLINAYSTNDWTLGVAFRASVLSQGLAGIQPVDVPGIENIR